MEGQMEGILCSGGERGVLYPKEGKRKFLLKGRDYASREEGKTEWVRGPREEESHS